MGKKYFPIINQINKKETTTEPEVEIRGKSKKIKKPSFTLSIVKAFNGKFLAGSFLKVVYDLFQFVGPAILDKLISFISDKEQNILVGIFYTILLFFSSFIQSFVLQHYFHRMFIVGARVRTSIINLVYKKVLYIKKFSFQVSYLTNFKEFKIVNIS